MGDAKSFLDNLKNLRMVMSVALDYMQENRDQFVKDATGSQVRQFEKSISQIRTFADRIETEFNTLEYLMGKRREQGREPS
jgi:tRNA U34 5-carboxymethylaminomethyl modifying GTPase MnmE/TrmE